MQLEKESIHLLCVCVCVCVTLIDTGHKLPVVAISFFP